MGTSMARNWGILRSLLIYYGQPWRRRQARRFYKQLIRPGDLCFDIGAHVGSRVSLWVAMGARCVAVEPLPHCMHVLHRLFDGNPDVILIEAAVGASPGKQTLHLNPRNPTIATLSTDWIDAVGRRQDFAGVRWEEKLEVTVTTLDSLIAAYGLPAFCKIDVEGFEHAVLQGLSHPIPLLSLEYTPADPAGALACIDRLGRLANYRFNWTTGEQLRLRQTHWLAPADIIAILSQLDVDEPSGDIYARLTC